VLQELLRSRGYEPYSAESGLLRLRNCPFDAVAAAEPQLVCRLNLALIEGLVSGLGDAQLEAVLTPRPGLCCVAIRMDRAQRGTHVRVR
jgi:predicted ArsR family transcriptional regulator